MHAASLLEIGEAFVDRNPVRYHLPVLGETGACKGGWSENASKDVYVNGESCMAWHRPSGRSMQQSEPPYELRSPVMRMERREVGK